MATITKKPQEKESAVVTITTNNSNADQQQGENRYAKKDLAGNKR